MGHFCKNKIKWFPPIILRTINHRAFKFHMLTGLGGKDMICIGFRFTKSKVKAIRIIFVKQWILFIIWGDVYYKDIIFHMLIGIGEAMTFFILDSLC